MIFDINKKESKNQKRGLKPRFFYHKKKGKKMSQIHNQGNNTQGFWSGLLSKKCGKEIPKTPFFIRPLTKENAKEMAHLSQEIYQHLKEDEQCFIHKHSQEYYHQIFKNTDVSFIGVFANNRLIAMSYLKICQDKKTFESEIPGFQEQSFAMGETVGTLGGDCVHPDYRGNKINQMMIEYRMAMAKEKNCQSVYSIIDRHNHWNMPPYFNNRFQMLSCGIDPSDGGEIAVMRYAPSQPVRIGKEINIPTTHFETIDTLLENNFVGCEYNAKTKTITFKRPALPVTVKTAQHIKQIKRIRNRIKERQYV